MDGTIMYTVSDAMTSNVVTVRLDDTLEQIRGVFARYKFHHVVVVERGRAVGVISDRDLLKHLSPFIGTMNEREVDTRSLQRRAHQVMTRKLIHVQSETPLAAAANLMMQQNVSCLPVLDHDEKCIGIITWRDLLRWMLNHCLPDACKARNAA